MLILNNDIFQFNFFRKFCSRFQSFYTAKTRSVTSTGFSRPPPQQQHHSILPEATVTSVPPAPGSGFLPPPPVGSLRLNKPSEIGPNRLSQPPSIGMGHPTFRSEFNVNLR